MKEKKININPFFPEIAQEHQRMGHNPKYVGKKREVDENVKNRISWGQYNYVYTSYFQCDEGCKFWEKTTPVT